MSKLSTPARFSANARSAGSSLQILPPLRTVAPHRPQSWCDWCAPSPFLPAATRWRSAARWPLHQPAASARASRWRPAPLRLLHSAIRRSPPNRRSDRLLLPSPQPPPHPTCPRRTSKYPCPSAVRAHRSRLKSSPDVSRWQPLGPFQQPATPRLCRSLLLPRISSLYPLPPSRPATSRRISGVTTSSCCSSNRSLNCEAATIQARTGTAKREAIARAPLHHPRRYGELSDDHMTSSRDAWNLPAAANRAALLTLLPRALWDAPFYPPTLSATRLASPSREFLLRRGSRTSPCL